METIRVTDKQYAYLEQLRASLEETISGQYASTRHSDAIQFLIDNVDPDLDLESAFAGDGPIETDVDAEDGDEDDAEDGDEDDEADDDDSEEEAEVDDENEDDSEDGDGDSEDGDDEAADEDSDDDEASTSEADDDDMLTEMMELLETHEDKWDESPKGDYRYRVDLPDGGSEDVQTKDDVRAILFKEYR